MGAFYERVVGLPDCALGGGIGFPCGGGKYEFGVDVEGVGVLRSVGLLGE